MASSASPSSVVAVAVTASSLMPSRGVAVAGIAGAVGAGVAVVAVAPAAALVASASSSAPSSTGGCCGGLLVCWSLKGDFLMAFGGPRSSSGGSVARLGTLSTRGFGRGSLGRRLSLGLGLGLSLGQLACESE